MLTYNGYNKNTVSLVDAWLPTKGANLDDQFNTITSEFLRAPVISTHNSYFMTELNLSATSSGRVIKYLVELGWDYVSARHQYKSAHSNGTHNKDPQVQARKLATHLKHYGVSTTLGRADIHNKLDYKSISEKAQHTIQVKRLAGLLVKRSPEKLQAAIESYQSQLALHSLVSLTDLSLFKELPQHLWSPEVKCTLCGFQFQTWEGKPGRSIPCCPRCTTNPTMGQKRSLRESQFQDWLSSIGVRSEHSSRILSPGEIDVYLPDHKIGFEFNGFYWHSGQMKPKFYHAEKTERALRVGIKLYHIWENVDFEQIKAFVLSLLHKTSLIYARKTQLITDKISSRDFINQYHFDGCPANLKGNFYSLVYNGEIVASVLIGHRGYGLEILRYATLGVVGGFNKLLHAVSLDFPGETLTTYCNRDLTPDYHDSVYYRNGFTFVQDSGPILRYYTRTSVPGLKSRQIYDRRFFMKSLLSQYWPDVDMTQTADQILERHGVVPVWNSGNWHFVKVLDN